MAAPGLPPLSLSSGPAVSSAAGYDGNSGTGPFFYKREAGIGASIERLAPLMVIGVLAWLAVKK